MSIFFVSLLVILKNLWVEAQIPEPRSRIVHRVEALIDAGRYQEAQQILEETGLTPESGDEVLWLWGRIWLATGHTEPLLRLCQKFSLRNLSDYSSARAILCTWWEEYTHPQRGERIRARYLQHVDADVSRVRKAAFRWEQLNRLDMAERILATAEQYFFEPYRFGLERVALREKMGDLVGAASLLLQMALDKPAYQKPAESFLQEHARRDSLFVEQMQMILDNPPERVLSSLHAFQWWTRLRMYLLMLKGDSQAILRTLLHYEKNVPGTPGTFSLRIIQDLLRQGNYPLARFLLQHLRDEPVLPLSIRQELERLWAETILQELQIVPRPGLASRLLEELHPARAPVQYAYVLGVYLGQPDSAREILDQYVSPDICGYSCWMVRGWIEMRSSQPWESVSAFLLAQEQASSRAEKMEARYWLAIAGFLVGEPQWARFQLKRILGYPDVPVFNDALQWWLFLGEKDDTAMRGLAQDFHRALQGDTHFLTMDVYVLWLKGEACFWKGQMECAWSFWIQFARESHSYLAPWILWRAFQGAYLLREQEWMQRIRSVLEERYPDSPYLPYIRERLIP